MKIDFITLTTNPIVPGTAFATFSRGHRSHHYRLTPGSPRFRRLTRIVWTHAYRHNGWRLAPIQNHVGWHLVRKDEDE